MDYASSDERIKENITDVPDNLSLQKLRDISCVYYNYKDKKNSSDKTIGFIAQQVKEHLPMAVDVKPDVLPSEMREIQNPIWTTIIPEPDLDGVIDPSGIKYKLTIPDLNENENRIQILC